ncbi:MAG: sensor histidine kinase [Corynebacterium sp.]|nr:sensor histidine kinase [Corynebacterium sp.]
MSQSLNQPADTLIVEPGDGQETLRGGMHVLTAALLIIAIVVSVGLPMPTAAINLALLTIFTMVYFAGAFYIDHLSRRQLLVWLAALTALWTIDIFVATAGIYLLFVLYFYYLRIMGMTWGIGAVLSATLVSIVAQVPQGLTFGGVMGPVVSALVTVAIYYAFQRLHEINVERAHLITELMSTREQLAVTEHNAGINAERQRIAHEIHDTLAQGLSSIQMLLHAADRDLDSIEDGVAKARTRIELARRTAADNLHEARAMIAALQPAGLSDTSLIGALERMTQGFAAAGELTIDVAAEGTPRQLPMKVEAVLLRVAQGAVGNITKHANATRARVTVTYNEHDVRVDVVDNGRGFNVDQVQARPAGLGHIGLDAMRRRAEEVGGEVAIESTLGHGTAISISIPLTDRVD